MPDDEWPFPEDTVRDLLGIARALHRSARAFSPGDRRTIEQLEQIVHELRMALELAQTDTGSATQRAACLWAERGTAHLCEIVASDMPLAPAVRAMVVGLRP
jgi:hypothetical protein